MSDRLMEKLWAKADLEMEVNGVISLDTQVALDAVGCLFDGVDPDMNDFEE